MILRTVGGGGASSYLALTAFNQQPACTVQVTSADSGADGVAANVAASLRRQTAAAAANDDRNDRPDRDRGHGHGHGRGRDRDRDDRDPDDD